MDVQKFRVNLRAANQFYTRMAHTLLPIPRFDDESEPAHSATLLLDFPLTWSLRELNRMSIRERARTVVFTTAKDLVYLDAIAAFHVSGILVPERSDALKSALYAAAFATRTYARGTDLTPTELRLVRLLFAGLETSEMAAILSVSPKTINAHFSNILQKLNLSSRLEILSNLIETDFKPA